MFKIEKVEKCPVTEESVGVIRMKPEHIGVLAGAVQDSIEWMLLLHGKRSDDGYEVEVERITAPKQSRSGSHATMEEIDLPDDVVGVVHSHHTMGAFFSGTDTNDLNPRFPTSTVVAQGRNNFGFNYLAEGKVKLPCGAVGVIGFALAVVGDEEYDLEPLRATHEGEVKSLMRCPKVEVKAETKYAATRVAACGLKESETSELHAIYGTECTEIMTEIRAQTVQPAVAPVKYHGYTPNHGYNGNHGWGAGWGFGSFVGGGNKKDKKHKAKGGGFTPAPQSRPIAYKSGCDVCGGKPPKIYYYRELKCWLCEECGEHYDAYTDAAWAEYVDLMTKAQEEKKHKAS